MEGRHPIFVVGIVVALLAAAAYLALAPAVVNGDGLGYLKAALDGTLYPGHLAYVPLLVLARKIVHAGPRAVDGLLVARIINGACGGLAVLFVGLTARRLAQSTRAGVIAAAGLAVSWGALSAGSDVESYAPALASLCAAIFCATHESPIAAGFAVAAAALFHVENVLFILPAMLLCRRDARLDRKSSLILAATATAIIAAAYALVLPAHGAQWLGGASHGLHYPLRWSTPAIAIYGACKALVYSPYPYEASWTRVLACFAAGAAALAMLLSSLRAARPLLPRAAVVAWLVPYASVGCAFYASDAERWTFLLPLLWLAVAPTEKFRRVAVTVAAVALANAVVWIPSARDRTLRDRASRAATHLADGDLVIGPGHGWDEYLGFYDGPRITPLPLVYFAGKLSSRDALARAIADAVAHAPRTFVARFPDSHGDDGDPLGWKELSQFGVTRENVRSLLPPGNLTDAGDGLQELTRP
jgi:hypothetical protein